MFGDRNRSNPVKFRNECSSVSFAGSDYVEEELPFASHFLPDKINPGSDTIKPKARNCLIEFRRGYPRIRIQIFLISCCPIPAI